MVRFLFSSDPIRLHALLAGDSCHIHSFPRGRSTVLHRFCGSPYVCLACAGWRTCWTTGDEATRRQRAWQSVVRKRRRYIATCRRPYRAYGRADTSVVYPRVTQSELFVFLRQIPPRQPKNHNGPYCIDHVLAYGIYLHTRPYRKQRLASIASNRRAPSKMRPVTPVNAGFPYSGKR